MLYMYNDVMHCGDCQVGVIVEKVLSIFSNGE